MKFLLLSCILLLPHVLQSQNSTENCQVGNNTADTPKVAAGNTTNPSPKPTEGTATSIKDAVTTQVGTTKGAENVNTARPKPESNVTQATANEGNKDTLPPKSNQTLQTTPTKPESTTTPESTHKAADNGGKNETSVTSKSHEEPTNTSMSINIVKKRAPEGEIANSTLKVSGTGNNTEGVTTKGKEEALTVKGNQTQMTTPASIQITVSVVKMSKNASEIGGNVAGSLPEGGRVNAPTEKNNSTKKPESTPLTEASNATTTTPAATSEAGKTHQTTPTKPENTTTPESTHQTVKGEGRNETSPLMGNHTESTITPRIGNTVNPELEKLVDYGPEDRGNIAKSPLNVSGTGNDTQGAVTKGMEQASRSEGHHIKMTTLSQAQVTLRLNEMANNVSEVESKIVRPSPKESGVNTSTQGAATKGKEEASPSSGNNTQMTTLSETHATIHSSTVGPNVVKAMNNASEIEGKISGSLPGDSGIGTTAKGSANGGKEEASPSEGISSSFPSNYTQMAPLSKNQTTERPNIVKMVNTTIGIEGRIVGPLSEGIGIATQTKTAETNNGTVEGANLTKTVDVNEEKGQAIPMKDNNRETTLANSGKDQTVPSQSVPIETTSKPKIETPTNQQIIQMTGVNKGKEEILEVPGEQLKMSLKLDIQLATKREPTRGCVYTAADGGKTKVLLLDDCRTKTVRDNAVATDEITTNASSCGNNLSDLMLLRNWNIRYIREENSEVEHLLIIKQETWANARKICDQAGMQLGSFADDNEFAYISRSMRGLCASCSETFWVKGTRNEDASKCKFVHLEEIDSTEKFCSKSDETRRSSFVCTRQIDPESTSINVTLKMVYPEKTKYDTYVFFAKPTTWDDAKRQCEERSMRLATFHGHEERKLALRMYKEKCSGCTGSYWVSGHKQEALAHKRIKRQVHPYWHFMQRRRPSWHRAHRQQWPQWSQYEHWPKYQAPRQFYKMNMPELYQFAPELPSDDSDEQEWVEICYSLALQSEKYLRVPCSEQPGQLEDRDAELRGFICSKTE